MQLTGLLPLLRDDARYQTALDRLRSNQPLPDQHVLRAARPYLIAALARDLGRPLIVITATVERAHNIIEQLPVWAPDVPTYRFAEPGALFYERSPWSPSAVRTRIGALAALCPPVGLTAADLLDPVNPHPPVIVTSALALMQRTLPPREFRLGSRLIKTGQRQDPDKLLRLWLGIGYTPMSVVTEPGTFSRRGGIIDVFPAGAIRPARLEFFGDEIDSLRWFDPATQRSAEPLDRLIVTPAREALPKYGGVAATALKDWFAGHQPNPAAEEAVIEPLSNPISEDYDDLRGETAFPALEYYLPYLYSDAVSLLDYAPDNVLIVIDDQPGFATTVADLEAQALDQRASRLAAQQIPANMPLPYLTWDDLQESLAERTALHLGGSTLSDANDGPDEANPNPASGGDGTLGDLFAPAAHYGGQLRVFLDTLRDAARKGERAVVITRQALRLTELWRGSSGNNGSNVSYYANNHTPITDLSEWPPNGTTAPNGTNGTNGSNGGNGANGYSNSGVLFIEGALTEGWLYRPRDGKATTVLSDAELFGWRRPEPRRHAAPRAKSPESLFADLSVGDYVVHSEYGVGRLVGMNRRMMEGVEREYFVVEFAGEDTLYVPIHQVDRLTRYVGPTDQTPRLHRLGSNDWQRDKEAARIAAEQVARELLELYAMRAHLSGHAFSADTPWQHEIEAAFPYIETEDQLRALKEVKFDMERPQPMDRLICGDVGFGKTEVALRAAFKAVMDNTQVAILVPTTVLAQQHYNTFSERMLPFPVKVDVISRFRTPQEQREIMAAAADGSIDILIGTHRLLQSDMIFKNLGLLIIDEEQRFGVTHKEKLKRLRAEVDVLAMTATPIPRTLYMSLTGVRDISIIQTPPEERLPVLTHVGPYEDSLVRQAILRELDRGGQVYFVHNRVSTIEAVARRLSNLVPEARIIVGHGQMEAEQLEDVMAAFGRGDADVLLSTTIIESGLDIPNANTIILDRADRFGLAQLYQLRGRVGRSAARAYAYFFHPRQERLTEDARARLQTIAEQTELGAGLSIAMRDLEIRGAGDLLGTRQSGYIASVGFHLYTQLLAQAVNQLKSGQNVTAPINPAAAPVVIELPVTAFVPTGFIADMSLRMQLYRRLANVQQESDVDALTAELVDRFGTLPPELEGLLFQLRVKLLAYRAHVTAINSSAGQLSIKLPYLGEIDRGGLQRFLGEDVRVSRTGIWLSYEQADWRERLLRVLTRLAVNQSEPAA